MSIQNRLQKVPRQSGVYILKDCTGQVLYVGKARSLRERVRSYFQGGETSPKTRLLQERVEDFEIFLTGNEVEAFILESNLIKKYQPKFNIRLKDDKSYPYLKINLKEPFPSIRKTRILENDGSRYFGPYTSVESVNRTLKMLMKLFPLRTCKKKIESGKKWQRACLNYHIKRCLGPCIGTVSPQEYREYAEQVILFLEGKQDHLLQEIRASMEKAASRQDYEKAAEYRDALLSMEKVREKQEVVWESGHMDVVGVSGSEDRACIQLFQIRHGRILGREHFTLEGTRDKTEDEVVTAFLRQYYLGGINLPREIVLPVKPAHRELLQEWLGSEVKLTCPVKGKKLRLVELARENAHYELEQEKLKEEESRRRDRQALEELQKVLGLGHRPEIIEGYDISNIQGQEAVGSQVVFVGGRPAGEYYRRYRIKTVEGIDDVAMLQEVLRRRLGRLADEKKEAEKNPLFLIDGGRGQVNAIQEVLKEEGYDFLKVIGLAKRMEEIYIPERKEPLRLDRDNRGLQLLQRVRDEAHRFALGYHRGLRLRSMTHSLLEEIPGVGPERRKALMEHFGTLAAVRQARLEDLCQVPGINQKTARVIRDFLQDNLQN